VKLLASVSSVLKKNFQHRGHKITELHRGIKTYVARKPIFAQLSADVICFALTRYQ